MKRNRDNFEAGVLAALAVLCIWGTGYALGWAAAAVPQDNTRCVNLQVEGPGHGTHGDRLLWVAAVCRDDDGLWRWAVPVEWSELQVSDRPPVEVP